MLRQIALPLATAALLTLAGCATRPPPEPEAGPRIDVDSYRVLAEIALAEERREEAAAYYLDAALVSTDPAYSARTAQLAYELGLDSIGHRAVARWREIEPDSAIVSYFTGIFETRSGRIDEAADAFSVVLETLPPPSRGQGFVQILDALNTEPNVTTAAQVMLELNTRYPGTPQGHYGLGQLALRAGGFELALRESQAAVDLAPEWPEAQLLHARTLLLAGRSDEALAIARELVDTTDNTGVRLQFAELLVSAGQSDEAEVILNDILDQNPGMPEAIRALGFLSLSREDLEDARRQFEMLRSDPDYRDETFYYLGRIAELESDYLQATRSYSRVTDGVRAVEAQIRAASIMFQHMGGAEPALSHLEDFGAASPRFAPEMLLARAQLLLQMGRAAEGMNLIDRAVAEQGAIVDESLRRAHVEFYVALMQDAIDRGDLLAADGWISEGLARYPENRNLRYAHSRLLQQQGELRRALRSLEELVDESPDDPTFLNALGYLMTDSLDRHRDARGYIQRALALDPENGAILDSMGWVLFHLDEYELALDYLERAYRTLPVTEVLAHLADVHWALGDQDLARQLIEDGLEESPGDPFLTEVRDRLLQ